jgi:hypothetical protein
LVKINLVTHAPHTSKHTPNIIMGHIRPSLEKPHALRVEANLRAKHDYLLQKLHSKLFHDEVGGAK